MENHDNHQRKPEIDPTLANGAPPQAAAPADAAAEAPEEDAGSWLRRNGLVLSILGALLIFVAWYYELTLHSWLTIGKVALGLGLVIFIHELGHFLVAKWCDVHVTVFSIGFGPPIPGCAFKWGETTYKLAVFPLGGYVQMVGQIDADESSDGSEDDPRSYRNKSVAQRMAIISAGVVMNAILAVICFIVVFQGKGREQQAAVVYMVSSDGPAAAYGVRTGDQILQIGSKKDPYFEDLMVWVMGTDRGEKVKFVSQRPQDKEPRELELQPRRARTDSRPLLGIAPSPRAELKERRDVDSGYDAPVYHGSAASRAQPPFEFGDVIIGVTDPDHPKDHAKMALRPDPRYPEQRDYFEFSRRMNRLAAQDVTIRVLRGDKEHQQQVDILVPPAYHRSFPMRMHMGEVSAIRVDSPAKAAQLQARETDDSGIIVRRGDVIEEVTVPEPDNQLTVFKTEPTGKDKVLDPVRLPFELRQWADRYRAKNGKDAFQGKKLVTLKLRHHTANSIDQYKSIVKELEWNDDWRFDKVEPMSPYSPLAIPELGLAYQIGNMVAAVTGAGQLREKDVIKKVKLYLATKDGGEKADKWFTLKSETKDQWAFVFWTLQSPRVAPKLTVAVERDGETEEITIQGREDAPDPKTGDPGWPMEDRGLMLLPDVRWQRADNIFEAVGMGFQDTWNRMTQVFENLRGILTGRISPENLGGPVTIARVAYHFAGRDFWQFAFFIGLISVNLAVINFLPIPVLDGGHMVFLLYEKIRGKPASEGIRAGATYAGLALILSLMVYVLYLDFFVH